MCHGVGEIWWHGPCSRSLGCEGDIRHGLVLVHDGGLDAAVFVSVVNEVVEEAVGHVAREDGGGALGGHALKGSDTALDQMGQAAPLREPDVRVAVFDDRRGEMFRVCYAVAYVVPVNGCGCWGGGEVGSGTEFEELIDLGELLCDETLQDG